MVNNNLRILVYGACTTTVRAKDGRTIITNGPVYDLAVSQSLLKVHGLRVLNDKADFDMDLDFTPALTDEELVDFICALSDADYEKSERSATSVKKTVDCDGYAMHWNRLRKCRWAHGLKIYVKFGFFENNPRCLVVSIHPARY